MIFVIVPLKVLKAIKFSFFALNIVKKSAKYLPLIINLVSLYTSSRSFFCHCIFVSLVLAVKRAALQVTYMYCEGQDC